jgi:hypothetical protein
MSLVISSVARFKPSGFCCARLLTAMKIESSSALYLLKLLLAAATPPEAKPTSVLLKHTMQHMLHLALFGSAALQKLHRFKRTSMQLD